MKLIDTTIRPVVNQWATNALPNWTSAEVDSICTELLVLSNFITPHIVMNTAASDADIQRYLLARTRNTVEDWLSKAASGIRQSLQIGLPKLGDDGAALIGLRSATQKELDGLTGIGDDRAKSIARLLAIHPLVSNISHLEAIDGIGPKTLDSLKAEAYLDKPNIKLVSASVLEFANNPTIENFLHILDNSDQEIVFGDGSTISRRIPVGGNSVERFFRLIELVRAQAEHSLSPASGVTAKEVVSYLSRHDLCRKYIDKMVPADGALLINAAYVPIALDLLNSANATIRLIMFLGTATPSNDSGPGSLPLIEALEARAAAGVSVQVILDRDEADDPFHSEDINKPLVNRLKAAGVDVKFDEPQTLLHSKFFVIDDTSVIVGSHNLTRTSFTQTHEVSVYLKSPEVATTFIDRFDILWAKFS